jgi:NAD(P)-dependent dehydrogenase (short-subunit alcohol dehydrogenase family)
VDPRGGRDDWGRFATPDDIAQPVAFLADSQRGSFINGATISIDGGWAADGSGQSLRLSARSR